MKKNKKYWVLVSVFLVSGITLQMRAFGSPIFPASDNQPFVQSTEKPETPTEAPKQNTSTETANLHKDTVYSLAQIDIKVLFGVNQDGEKASKSTYQLNEVSGDKDAEKKEPRIQVTYKDKKDADKYAVSEVYIKKMQSNSYQITSKIVELKPDEIITPKIVYLN